MSKLSIWDTGDMIFRRDNLATLLAKGSECQLYQQTAFAHLINQTCFHKLGNIHSQKKGLSLEQ